MEKPDGVARGSKAQKTKLIRLGVPNQIVVIESNLKSKYDRRFWSDSKSNDGFESMIAISIKINIILITVDQFRLKDRKRRFKCRLFKKKVEFNQKC